MKRHIRTVVVLGGAPVSAGGVVPPSAGNMRYMITFGIGGTGWTGGGIEEFVLNGLSVNPGAPLMAPMVSEPIPVVSLFGWEIPAYDTAWGKWIWENVVEVFI